MRNELAFHLVEQLDWHWRTQLRPRLDGLTDDEYFWEPVPDCWGLHPDGTIDFVHPPPRPEPVTTTICADRADPPRGPTPTNR